MAAPETPTPTSEPVPLAKEAEASTESLSSSQPSQTSEVNEPESVSQLQDPKEKEEAGNSPPQTQPGTTEIEKSPVENDTIPKVTEVSNEATPEAGAPAENDTIPKVTEVSNEATPEEGAPAENDSQKSGKVNVPLILDSVLASIIGTEPKKPASPEQSNPTADTTNTDQTTEENNQETSECNKKALELVLSVEGSIEETGAENELDIKELSQQILGILNEGRVDEELDNEQLKQKSIDLQDFITRLIQVLKDKTDLCAGLDRQNAALIHQAKTLKNVVGITKDLLSIRNMEVEHLQADLKLLEDNITAERTRHDLLLKKLAEALHLNEQLKTEYTNQSGLFSSLREKYHEKIVLLTKENQRLQKLVYESNGIQPSEEGTAPQATSTEETTAEEPEPQSNEVVEK